MEDAVVVVVTDLEPRGLLAGGVATGSVKLNEIKRRRWGSV